jgi:hypothetical protein
MVNQATCLLSDPQNTSRLRISFGRFGERQSYRSFPLGRSRRITVLPRHPLLALQACLVINGRALFYYEFIKGKRILMLSIWIIVWLFKQGVRLCRQLLCIVCIRLMFNRNNKFIVQANTIKLFSLDYLETIEDNIINLRLLSKRSFQ